MYKHPCIKLGCATVYESTEPDAYYCPEHLAEKKRIAAELDKKYDTREVNNVQTSALKEYEASAKTVIQNGRTVSFGQATL